MATQAKSAIHPKVLTTFAHVNKLILAFLAINIVFIAAVLLLQSSFSDELTNTLMTRGISFIVVSALLLFFHRKMVNGKRWAWVRLRIMSIIAPISIAIFLFTTSGLVWWVDALQIIGAGIYIYIAFLINQEHMHHHFPKPKKA